MITNLLYWLGGRHLRLTFPRNVPLPVRRKPRTIVSATPLSFRRQPLIALSVYLFHTAFQSHVPIVHPSTWTFEGKSPILGLATQACGAQFVKSQAAKDFVSQTLHSAREKLLQVVRVNSRALETFLMMELHQAKSTIESEGMIDMILTGLLVQTINLFRQTVDQRPAASHFHGMLVTASRYSPSEQNDILNFCTLVDQTIWPHELMLKLDTSESFCGGSITD